MRAAGLVTREVAEQLAIAAGVCIRPIPMRRQDAVTGVVDTVDLPCGSWRESWCPPCASGLVRCGRRSAVRAGTWSLNRWWSTRGANTGPTCTTFGSRLKAGGMTRRRPVRTPPISTWRLTELDAEIGALEPVSRTTADLADQEDAGDDVGVGVRWGGAAFAVDAAAG